MIAFRISFALVKSTEAPKSLAFKTFSFTLLRPLLIVALQAATLF
jgi:hypothetical protein